MKKLSTLFSLLFVLSISQMQGQRYLEEIFDEVTVTTDVQYGMNATVIAYALLGEAIPEPLIMDVYEPTGDVETDRPVILYFHTGNFLPHPENGSPSGLRTDSSAVEICSRFARMGYVVASCDYRLGWNPLAETQEERVTTLINAAYRGVQDCRTAVRYFRMTEEEESDPWGIDPGKIAVWGQGTGGYISFTAASLSSYDEILIPKFITTDGEGNPIPMVIEAVNGDIYGTTYGVNPLDNDTLCYTNHVGYSSDINVAVNMGGAMGDISWYNEGETPIISFHVPTDPFAPYVEGTVIVPGFNLPVVEVQGSYTVQEVGAGFGNNDVFASANLDDVWSQAANANNDGFDGLYPMIRPEGSEFDSAPWEWWDPETNPNNENGLATNPDMSPEKGRMFIDTIQGYSAPRLMCALQLEGNPCEQTGPPNDLCEDATDINANFGGDLNDPNESGPYSNVDAGTEGDPANGNDCFDDNNGDGPSFENTVWFTFVGDGEIYNIETNDCGGTVDFFEGDTQMAVYSGDCTDLMPVECNEDLDFDNGDYWAGVQYETTAGTTYYIIVDGYDYTGLGGEPATGEFCLEVTQIDVNVEEIDPLGLSLYPNPANNEINLTAEQVMDYVEVYNVVGELVLTANPVALRANVNIETLESGIYLVQAYSGNQISTMRFVKK